MNPKLKTPWTGEAQELVDHLESDSADGISESDAAERLQRYGKNELRSIEARSWVKIFLEQFQSLIIALLAVAAALSFAFGENVEAAAVVAVIIINSLIGFFTELKASRSMEALKELGSVRSKVIRNGSVKEVEAEVLVPGDVVLLEAGDIVTADVRILRASRLQADESPLTGESLPVAKQETELKTETSLPNRKNILYKGTAVTRGSSRGLVIATGMDTEIGKVSSLVESAEEERTPLEKRLDRLGHKLIWVTLAVAGVTAVSGIIAGKETLLMVKTSIALAVAAIPEGLPIVATIALARGMWRMSRRNVLINRLSAVETLGATTIICTDKTGTLTENRMTVTRIDCPVNHRQVEIMIDHASGNNIFRFPDDTDNLPVKEAVERVLSAAVLCNNATLAEGNSVGDPMETALLKAGELAGLTGSDLGNRFPRRREEAFDSETMMMATFHESKEGFRVAVKGAPETVLRKCTSLGAPGRERPMTDNLRDLWLERNRSMASQGLRVLAVAEKTVDEKEEEPYRRLSFLGLVGFMDPPREDVKPALDKCRHGGVRVVMVTGDQPLTAENVARDVGLLRDGPSSVWLGSELKPSGEMESGELSRLLNTSIFSRVSPEQKLNIVDAHQENGEVVAMTGDGVNDAPALKKADIGVTMGRRGTQVAREASDMVIKDDAFSSIVAAVEQGRIIFENIRKFVIYLLSCNVSEIMTVSLATLAGGPLPILPLQILFLNLVTDVFPALALGVGQGDSRIMDRPPRDPSEAVITRGHWWLIAGYSGLITAAVLGALAAAILLLDFSGDRAVTVSFLTLAFAQLWHVFNMRKPASSSLSNEITRNIYVWGALALCVLILLAAVYLKGLSSVLSLSPPGASGWLLIIAASLFPLIAGQFFLHLRKK